jgi:tctex1 domain-containing protein 2
MTFEELEDASDFAVGPSYAQKFKESEAKIVIQTALKRRLMETKYHPDNTSTWAKEIADDIKQEMKEKGWVRYKFVVHVVIAEQKGEGIKLACKCFWDRNTDAFAKDIFENKSIFAVATVYGVYYY